MPPDVAVWCRPSAVRLARLPGSGPARCWQRARHERTWNVPSCRHEPLRAVKLQERCHAMAARGPLAGRSPTVTEVSVNSPSANAEEGDAWGGPPVESEPAAGGRCSARGGGQVTAAGLCGRAVGTAEAPAGSPRWPAAMAARYLDSPRDAFLASDVSAACLSCSARCALGPWMPLVPPLFSSSICPAALRSFDIMWCESAAVGGASAEALRSRCSLGCLWLRLRPGASARVSSRTVLGTGEAGDAASLSEELARTATVGAEVRTCKSCGSCQWGWSASGT